MYGKTEIIVNLNDDIASFIFDGYAINTWQWTQGAGGGIGPKSLEAINFYGLTPDIEMYIDNFEDYLWWVPVELVSFTTNVHSGEVILNWSTATETNNSGFEIQKKKLGVGSQELREWNAIGFVLGFGTTTEPKSYSFADEDVTTGIYKYRLKQIDFDGSFEYSNEIEVTVDFTPKEFVLHQNYPNPFNPTTIIKFEIPNVGTIRQVVFTTLKVYDILGNEVATLVNEEKQPGVYETEFNASELTSGIYFYMLQQENLLKRKRW